MSPEFLVFVAFFVGLGFLGWRKLSGRSGLPTVEVTPDAPVAFGYKISWLAVQGITSSEVADVLATADPRYAKTTFKDCNWASGMARIQHSFLNREVFISPPTQGWVFVVNWNPPDEMAPNVKTVLEALSIRGRAGFFASHRVSSYASWALAEDGVLIRHLSDADGETFANFGPVSEYERPDILTSLQLNAMDISPDQEDDFYDRLPDEADVIEVASRFSTDPTRLADHPSKELRLGLIGR